jgi:DNA-directed RNA polymerase II subunit RPB1
MGSDDPKEDCPGYFGHIELAKPVFHVGWIKEVVKILRCVCVQCSMLHFGHPSKTEKVREICRNSWGKRRLAKMYKLCDGKSCDPGDAAKDGINELHGDDGDSGHQKPSQIRCGAKQPKFRLEQLVIYKFEDDVEGGRKNKSVMSAEEVFNIFKAISDEDCSNLGMNPRFCRPESLICSVLPVPPLHVRPPVETGKGGGESQDDLTFLLADIVKLNAALDESVRTGKPQNIVQEYENALTAAVCAWVDNESTLLPVKKTQKKSGRIMKSLRMRLKGKEGRIRKNLMGKRVDFSARTVITADPILAIDQVGVPKSIALNLTYPEMVTPFNIRELQKLVANGPETHPGAKHVVLLNKKRKDLRYVQNKNDLRLDYGMIVERHIRDDDIVLFNRQPTLHKMSIMGHRVKVLDWSTFRMNLSVTSPYNADFDGGHFVSFLLSSLPCS